MPWHLAMERETDTGRKPVMTEGSLRVGGRTHSRSGGKVPCQSADGGRGALQANKEGPEQGHAMQASGGTTGMVQSEHPESAETSGAPILGGTALPLETKDAQENNQPVPADQHGVHSQPGDLLFSSSDR